MGEIVHVVTDVPEVIPARPLIPAPSYEVEEVRPLSPLARIWRSVTALSPEEYLGSTEEILKRSKLHWIVPVRAVLQSMAAMPLAMLLAFVLGWLFLGVLLLQIILWLPTIAHQCYMAYLILQWNADVVVLTDQRLIRTRGVFTTSVDAANLDMITSSSYYSNFFGKIFNYGTLRVVTAGDNPSLEQIDFLPTPAVFYRIISA
jgi:hypothetical protein